MPIAIPLGWLARWGAVKALGWSGIGRWIQHRAQGAATGSWAWALVVCTVVVAALVVWRWAHPPPRLYTAAEINANRLERVLAATREALEAKERIIEQQGKVLAVAHQQVEKLEAENAELRESAPRGRTVVLGDDDLWLQRKRARSGGTTRAGGR